ncbi:MAG: hypothetical protein L0Y66_08800 [Myxococcaceae bacterium]|nr:hypothetical protein [Myxococcaceae bacterium]MCI0669374.1 hypothetical protein [Myxococcaceae bacterium]
MPSLPGTDALSAALRALPPRTARLLEVRLLEGRSLPECADLYGISPEAFAIHQLRATRALAEQLGWVAGGTRWSGDEEARLASGLQSALVGASASTQEHPRELAPLVELSRGIRAEAEALRRALRASEESEARAPKRLREERLQQAAVVALVALTLYFLLRGES